MFLLILLQYYYYHYLDNQLFNLLYTTVIVVSIFLLLFIRTKYRNLFVDFCYFSGISYLYSSNYTNNYQMVIVKNRFLNGSGSKYGFIIEAGEFGLSIFWVNFKIVLATLLQQKQVLY